MKKLIAILLVVVLVLPCFGMVAQAKVGDVIGTALHTDIVAYINHYAIPSYAVNGQSVIVAEDLKNFGFDVFWNEYERTLSISRNNSTKVTPMDVRKEGATGAKFTNILATDIKVYAAGQQITSYAMNGYTMIPMEELKMFGNVYWVAGERALKLWVDGLHALEVKQEITPYVATGYISYYPGTSTPTFESVTGIAREDVMYGDGYTFYVYPYTYYGEYDEFDDYGYWLMDHGWSYAGSQEDGDIYYETFYTDYEVAVVFYDAALDMVYVVSEPMY